jgi:hypothetical protein
MKAKQRAATRISLASTAIFPNTIPRDIFEKQRAATPIYFGNDVHGNFPIPSKDEFERQRTAT